MKGKNKKRKKHRGRNLHHFLKTKARGGDKSKQNLLLMDIEKHEHWHILFGLMSCSEVIELLIRVERAKRNQK